MYNIGNEEVRQDIVKIQQAFLTKVYGWMMLGLLVTALASFFTITNESVMRFVFGSKITFYGLFIVQFGIVIFLIARIQKMTSSVARAMFVLYSAITGVTLSSIFLAFTAESIASTFGIAALMFGAMAFYGYITKRDLTGVGQFMMMGLIGVVIASVVNIFMGSDSLGWLISIISVVVFTGLTAYDTQKMKAMAYVMLDGEEVAAKGAIIGALQLYLDFINLFLALLRLFGDRR
jgi:FtsH-binding integral membrane protein